MLTLGIGPDVYHEELRAITGGDVDQNLYANTFDDINKSSFVDNVVAQIKRKFKILPSSKI